MREADILMYSIGVFDTAFQTLEEAFATNTSWVTAQIVPATMENGERSRSTWCFHTACLRFTSKREPDTTALLGKRIALILAMLK